MSSESACLIIYYGGRLSVNDQFTPTYEGGRNRPIQVSKHTSFEDLKLRILRSLKFDLSGYNITIVCRFPTGSGYIASYVTDDEVCETILSIACREPLVVYVEVEPMLTVGGHLEHVYAGQSQPSYMELLTGISQTTNTRLMEDAIISRVPNHLNKQQLASTSVTQLDRDNNCVEAGVSDYNLESRHEAADDDYETMNSGSSTESNDSDADCATIAGEDDLYVDLQSHDLIKDYAARTSNSEKQMISSNEYIHTCKNSREWDAEEVFDGPSDETNFIDENTIPTELFEGMCFAGKKELQFALYGWSIINNVEFQIFSSNKKKFTITCVQSDNTIRPCMWRLHAGRSKRLGGAWVISSLGGRHTCTHPIMNAGHRQCNSKFISHYILPSIRRQIDLKPREIIGRIESKFNVRVSYMKAWDVRRKAIKEIFGSWEESYRSLNRLMEAICTTMPGSVYRTQSNSTNRFERVFWAFGPSITGWSYCRPVLSMDGTFLLGKYRGTLLTAVGIDANNGLFPFAFAVVESECVESWIWFLRNLNDLIPSITTRQDLCIISDRHAGLVRGCREIFPWAAHRHCLRHLRENFKKAVRGMGIGDVEFLCQKMYVAGNTDDLDVFNRHITDIKNVKEECYKWLVDRDVTKWALSYDSGFRYGTMTTNASECFNGVLKRARGLPIQALITSIYYNIVGLFIKRVNSVTTLLNDNESPFAPRIKSLIRKYEQEARRLPEPTQINSHEVQVLDLSCRSFKVEILNDGHCTCRCLRPHIYHIPCAHVIAALGLRRVNHQSYVSAYYSLAYYKQTYESEFHVIPDRAEWPPFCVANGVIQLNPPNLHRRHGRPRTKRYTNTMDETRSRSTRICGYCKVIGHTRTTCPRRQIG